MTTARVLMFGLLIIGSAALVYGIHTTHHALNRLLAYRAGTTQDGDTRG